MQRRQLSPMDCPEEAPPQRPFVHHLASARSLGLVLLIRSFLAGRRDTLVSRSRRQSLSSSTAEEKHRLNRSRQGLEIVQNQRDILEHGRLPPTLLSSTDQHEEPFYHYRRYTSHPLLCFSQINQHTALFEPALARNFHKKVQ